MWHQAISVVQEVFVAESVAAVDAVGRELVSQVVGSVPAMATLSLVESLGPFRPLVLPVTTPLIVLSRLVAQPPANPLQGTRSWHTSDCLSYLILFQKILTWSPEKSRCKFRRHATSALLTEVKQMALLVLIMR